MSMERFEEVLPVNPSDYDRNSTSERRGDFDFDVDYKRYESIQVSDSLEEHWVDVADPIVTYNALPLSLEEVVELEEDGLFSPTLTECDVKETARGLAKYLDKFVNLKTFKAYFIDRIRYGQIKSDITSNLKNRIIYGIKTCLVLDFYDTVEKVTPFKIYHHTNGIIYYYLFRSLEGILSRIPNSASQLNEDDILSIFRNALTAGYYLPSGKIILDPIFVACGNEKVASSIIDECFIHYLDTDLSTVFPQFKVINLQEQYQAQKAKFSKKLGPNKIFKPNGTN